ncbi:type 1 fimbria pilin [Serratia fonticola]|uniref:Type 1 fimbria pilin n=1 Tax=Serratia fonticola TaxID=47917 RepID=A0A559T1C4_SERFO|nr:fimbrial protein [Serratia fonticola]TQI79105.1 type 1 fimbria pilin [Serratia fonticola]TQI98872.1 type 1 fimbria pilin [Serratia fonticola]TVZ68397.1 type 1 fimbria pilin [Serratia fonticola]
MMAMRVQVIRLFSDMAGKARLLPLTAAMFFTLYGASSGFNVASADDDPQNLVLHGTLITPPPCRLNGGNTLLVSFGDKVGIKKVASGIYRKPVDLDLDCDATTAAWQLSLTYTGMPVTFDTDNATVRTAERAVLGVKIFANGQPLKLNEPLKINNLTMPALEAVLVQAPGSDLDDGAFTARATFRAEYH